MIDNVSVSSLLNAIVPISRFNKGEANKIFDEVSLSGYKIVVKNNKPTCVLITPEKYEEMVEMIEDYKLLIEAEARTKNNIFISEKEVLARFNVTDKDLADVEVEIE